MSSKKHWNSSPRSLVERCDEARLAAELALLNKQCTPEFVFSIVASPQVIREAAAQVPEEQIKKGHDDEAGIQRRLKLFESQNEVGTDTVLACFEDLKVPVTSATQHLVDATKIRAAIIEFIGEPHNYGLTEEEKQAIREAQEAKEKAEADQRAKEKAEKDAAEAERLQKKIQNEQARKEQIASMDESQLLRAAMPLRKYLQSNVMAVIRQGLIECAEVRPNDPIDYLAEYLLENNPSID